MANQEKNIAETVREMAELSMPVRQLPNGAPFLLLPHDYSMLDAEKTLVAPIRKRGGVVMNDAGSFISYFNLHKAEGSHIFGAITPPSFFGQLNGHTGEAAGWGDHTVSYACPLAREWVEWTGYSGKQQNQIQFAEFIETHLPDIHGTDGQPTGAELLEVATSFKATSKSNFGSGIRLANGNVDFQFTEETGATAGAKGSIKVPETFFIAVPVFEGGAPYKVEAKLRYRIKDGTLALWYELVRPHVTLEAAFKESWDAIATGTETPIWRGKPA